MGLGLTAAQSLPAGTTWYLATVDNYLPIPQKTFTAIRLAGKKYQEWKMLQKSIEMVAVYSPRWNTVNFSLDGLRFLNHGVEEGEGENGVGNVIIGGTAVGEDTLVGWSAWTTSKSYEKVDFEVLDKETELKGPVEILLTRGQFEVYVQSGLERDIDKALLMVIAQWGVWDEGRDLWVVRVPVEV
ncbi:hypothetical protein TWF281_011737 [Arthrobotrys megalospora]